MSEGAIIAEMSDDSGLWLVSQDKGKNEIRWRRGDEMKTRKWKIELMASLVKGP